MRRSHVSILAAFALVALAACGGSAKASGNSSTSTTVPGGRRFANAAFTACLKDHGVTLPAGFGGRRSRPGGGSGATGATGATGGRRRGFFGGTPSIPGVSSAKAQAAFAACRSKLPNGGRFGGGFGRGANRAALTAYISCLGDHGVKVPTPTSGSTPTSGRFFRSPLAQLRRDPKFAAANQICRALLPTFGSGSTTTTSP